MGFFSHGWLKTISMPVNSFPWKVRLLNSCWCKRSIWRAGASWDLAKSYCPAPSNTAYLTRLRSAIIPNRTPAQPGRMQRIHTSSWCVHVWSVRRVWRHSNMLVSSGSHWTSLIRIGSLLRKSESPSQREYKYIVGSRIRPSWAQTIREFSRLQPREQTVPATELTSTRSRPS